MPKNSGFTLIELLIVISIIAVLSVMGMIIYGTVLKNGRDAKRQTDLRTIQSALEQYRADKGYYPASPLGGSINNGTRNYLNTVPSDPKPPSYPQYSYVASSCDVSGANCMSYCLSAVLENPASTTVNQCPSSGYNYSLTPP